MKNLLLTTLGIQNHFTIWHQGSCNFDTIIVKYHEFQSPHVDRIAQKVLLIEDFKYPALQKAIEQLPEVWDYDFIWMPDEDVHLSTEHINLLFNWAQKCNIDLGQPSIHPRNYTWPSTVNQPRYAWREVTTVEIMCPLFSRQALQQCIPTFNECLTGWGLEALWQRNVGPEAKIGVLDRVKAVHTRPINFNSRIYKKLKNLTGLTPQQEMANLLRKHQVQLKFQTLRPHISY